MPVMSQGAEEAERINEEIKNSRPGRYRMRQLFFKDDDPKLIRPITDHDRWITIGVHSFVPTKDKPASFPGDKWPKAMWGVCPNDRTFRLRDADGGILDEYEEGFGGCWVHEHLVGTQDGFGNDRSIPAVQTFGVAVLREPVHDQATGEVVGFSDVMVEFRDEAGAIHKIPHFVIIGQKYSNFWSAIKAACYVAPGTACDKDFIVKKAGKEYTIQSVNTTPDHRPGTASWKAQYTAALELVGFDLGQWLTDAASYDHYARWFIPGVEPKDGYGKPKDGTEGEGASASAPSNGSAAAAVPAIDQAAMADFRDSLASRKKG